MSHKGFTAIEGGKHIEPPTFCVFGCGKTMKKHPEKKNTWVCMKCGSEQRFKKLDYGTIQVEVTEF